MAVYREDSVFPAAVVDETGRLLGSILMDKKAVQKSVEGGVLWVRHGESERILPWPGEPRLVSLKNEGDWYCAMVAAKQQPAAGSGPAEDGGAKTGGSGETGGAETAPAAGTDVLRSLAGVIRRRREELPEGSYTTHLFTKGEEKIRKKTGEEAVELILARDPGELRYEAADLIYHLLVLLEETGVGLEAVLDELKGRE